MTCNIYIKKYQNTLMLFVNFSNYPDDVQSIVKRLEKYQGKTDENHVEIPRQLLTENEKMEFMEDLKKFIDSKDIEFPVKMFVLAQFAFYPKDVDIYIKEHDLGHITLLSE